MPYFAAAYCGARALPRTITVEPMLTMEPQPWSSIREPNSCVHAMVPLMSTASTWSTDSSVRSRHDICSRATSPTLLMTGVHLAELVEGLLRERLHVVPVGDVGLEEGRRGAGLLDLRAVSSAPAFELR